MPQADPYTGLTSGFSLQLHQLLSAVQKAGGNVSIASGFRSRAEQQTLYNNAVTKYGTAQAANWAAPPGSSNHESGNAADVHGDEKTMQLLHTLAPQFGLAFPLGNEPWHVQPVGLAAHDNQGGPPAATALPNSAPPTTPTGDQANTPDARIGAVLSFLGGGSTMPNPTDTGMPGPSPSVPTTTAATDPNAPSTPVAHPPTSTPPTLSGDRAANEAIGKQVAQQYGWGSGASWDAVNKIVMSESGWDANAKNKSSSASGIAQNIRGFGPDYQQNNPQQQVTWLMNYIKGRYGSPEKAWDFHTKNGWY